MAINTTRLMQRLGKYAGWLNEINTYRGTTLQTRADTVYAQYASVNPSLVSGLYAARDAAVSAMDGAVSYIKQQAAAVIIQEVQNDRTLTSASLPAAVTELRRQMLAAGDTLNDCPATIVNATVAATGNPTTVSTGKDGSGVEQDLIIPDVYLIRCSADKDTNGTKWRESFALTGKTADGQATNFGYPLGSGQSTTLTVIDPATQFGVAADGGFHSWNSGSPNTLTSWTAGTGSIYGTHLTRATDDPRASTPSESLALVGDGVVIPSVLQQVTVAANSTYAVHLRMKKVNDPGTDWAVTVRLVDAASGGAVLSSSTTLSSVACSTISADWLNVLSGTFITPAVLPAAVYLEVRLHQSGSVTTAPANLAQVYVNHLSVSLSTALYTGGPRYTMYSGTIASVLNDAYTSTVTITGTMSTFLIREIDRLVDLRSTGVRIPTVAGGGETQLDSLVS